MQVTVKLATREGAAHISGILAGFTLLAKRGELTLRVLDARQGTATSTTTRRRCRRCSAGQMWCSSAPFRLRRTGSSQEISPQSCGRWV